MKITTWNVNGLRAHLNKGAFDWFSQSAPDVICLQEIKARPEQLTSAQHSKMASHSWIWHPAERPGYSGVATGLKTPLPDAAVDLQLGVPEFDREGRVIRTDHEDFILFNIYFPNGSRDHSKVPFKLAFYERLLEICDRLHAQGQRIILTGDFNTSHQEIDLTHPKANARKTGFMPEERVWIDRYLEHGFVDAWRARNPDRVQYTWWSMPTNARARNVGWRLDYFLVSEALMKSVEDVVIHDEVMGSDHCPVTLVIK